MQSYKSFALALALGFTLATGTCVLADDAKPVADQPACGAAAGKAGCPMAGAKADAKAQTACPMMGGNVNKKFYADYEGKRVYFCCQDCVKAFQKDPAAVLKKMAEQGIVPEAVPAKAEEKK